LNSTLFDSVLPDEFVNIHELPFDLTQDSTHPMFWNCCYNYVVKRGERVINDEVGFLYALFKTSPFIALKYIVKFRTPFEYIPYPVKEYICKQSDLQIKMGNNVTPIALLEESYDQQTLEIIFLLDDLPIVNRSTVSISSSIKSAIITIYNDYIKTFVSQTKLFLSEMFSLFLQASKVAIPLMLLIKLTTYIFGGSSKKQKCIVTQPNQAQYNPVGNKKKTFQRDSRRRARDIFNDESIVNQADTSLEQCMTLSTNSQWLITVGSDVTLSIATAIAEKCFLMNCHTAEMILAKALENDVDPDSVSVKLTNNKGHVIEFPFSVIMKSPKNIKRDLIMFHLPSAPDCKDLRSQWASEQFITGYLSNMRHRFSGFLNVKGTVQYYNNGFGVSHYIVETEETDETRQAGVSYVAMTRAGYCGGHVGVTDSSQGSGSKIIGIHTAGSDGFGPCFGALITKRDLDRMIDICHGRHVADPIKEVIGIVTPTVNTYVKGNSVVVPSRFPMKKPTTTPVQCNDPKVYDKARAKYTRDFKIDPSVLNHYATCLDAMFADLENKSITPFVQTTYNMDQAIFGIEGSSFKPLDLQTSPGYPFSAMGLHKSKLIGSYVGGKFRKGEYSESIEEDLNHFFETLSLGAVPPTPFTDNVKYECLPIEKVQNGKGRMVSASTLIRVIACRMLFGPFSEWIMENHLYNEIALGDNLLGPDADYIARQHLSYSQGKDVSSAGDYSAFDASHSIDILSLLLEKLCAFCDDGTSMDRLRRVYVRSYIGTFHIRGDSIDIMNSGLSSGDPLTSIINSLINKANIRYVAYAQSNYNPYALTEFMSNVFLRVLGDDNSFTTSPDWSANLNEQTCSIHLSALGYTYTNDAKDGLTIGTRPFDKVTFLKRATRFEPLLGVYVAPLNLDVVLEIPLWTKSMGKTQKPSIDLAKNNADACLRELCLHEQSIWDHWFPKLCKMYEEYDWKPLTKSRKFCLQLVYSDYM